MNRAALEEVIDSVIGGLAGGETLTPTSLTFLLRCYGVSDRADIGAALEPALARALQLQGRAQTADERTAWLVLFSDALTLSADDRLRDAATALIAALRRGWGHSLDIAGVAASTEACLRASRTVEAASLTADAIDELERIVGIAYKPGAGLAGADREGSARLADLVATASALLTAYEVSARLPYSMLAEELMQFARRTLWNEAMGCFVDVERSPADMCRLNCAAARVFCGLAALHRDPDYVAAAIIGPDAAYAEDAGRILASQEKAARSAGLEAAAYGLALVEWLALT